MAAVYIIAYLISFALINITFKIEYIYLSFFVVIIPASILELMTMYWRSKNLAYSEYQMSVVFSWFLFYTQACIMARYNEFIFSSGIILLA